MISLEQYRQLLEGAGYHVRADRGRLILRGADRLPYLHGLLTNDIAALQPGTGCYAALLTAQGRMVADMRVFETGEMVLVDLDRSLAEPIREHFDRFVITEDVSIENASDTLVQIGVYGPAAEAIVRKAVPQHPLTIPSNDFGLAGFELMVPPDRASSVEEALRSMGAIAVDGELLEVTRVEAGAPRFLVDMDTTTIPLEAGIEDRAISFTKGCYVGQEVIIRVMHRGGGRVAKKLVGLRSSGALQKDARVLVGEREVGRVTSAVVSPRFGPIALAYVQREYVEPGTEVSVRVNGSEVGSKVTALPFRD